MKKSLFVLLTALVAILLTATPMLAGKPQSLNIDRDFQSRQSTTWVEQQDDWPQPEVFITNPLRSTCAWAADDHAEWIAFGNLNPSASTSRADCIISDYDPVYATRYGTTGLWNNSNYGFAGIRVRSVSPDLILTVCYEPQGRCFTASPIWDAAFNQWKYSFCGRANYGPNDPALKDIEGSNGGRGVITTVTSSISNPTGRIIKNISVAGGLSSDGSNGSWPGGCETRPTEGDYPFINN